jgi:hypothetical protein
MNASIRDQRFIVRLMPTPVRIFDSAVGNPIGRKPPTHVSMRQVATKRLSIRPTAIMMRGAIFSVASV